MNEKLSKEELLAKQLHETYERLAPQFGYQTRRASAVPWDDVPENNKKLMIATVREIFIQKQPTTTKGVIRELASRLRDTSRQTLYETKLRRWLESIGVKVEEALDE